MRLRVPAAAVLLAFGLSAGSAVLPGGSGMAWAQADVAVDNVRMSVGAIAYRAPRMQVRGTTLSKAEIEALFNPATSMPLAERVNLLVAREIVVPELIGEVTSAAGVQTTTYRDVVLTGISGGRIGSIVSPSGSISGPPGPTGVEGTFGASTVSDLDVGLAVSLFTDRAGPTPGPMKKLYGSFSVDAIAIKGDQNLNMKIARAAGRDIGARPTPETWLSFFKLAEAPPDLEKASPAERKRFLTAFVDVFSAFEMGSAEMTGLEMTGGPSKDGATTRIDKVAFTGASGTRGSDMKLDGLEVRAADGFFKLKSFTVGGVSIASALEALRNLPTGDDGPSPAQIRKLIPEIGRISIEGLDGDFPDSKAEGRAGNRIRLSLGGFDMTAAKPIQGIPSELSIAIKDSFVTLPADQAAALTDLGYDQLKISMGANIGFDAAKQELSLRDLSFSGPDMGAVSIRTTLGNVSPDVFDPDSAVAFVALLGATAKSAQVTVVNGGLADRILTITARRQGRNPEDLRREQGMTAAVGIPALLGNSDSAKALGQAVAKFVAKPGKLVVEARAKNPAGFSVADFSAAPDPASVMEKLDVRATAE